MSKIRDLCERFESSRNDNRRYDLTLIISFLTRATDDCLNSKFVYCILNSLASLIFLREVLTLRFHIDALTLDARHAGTALTRYSKAKILKPAREIALACSNVFP